MSIQQINDRAKLSTDYVLAIQYADEVTAAKLNLRATLDRLYQNPEYGDIASADEKAVLAEKEILL